jgi:hypothetical protein
MLGLMMTSYPGLTKAAIPPRVSTAKRVIAAGSGPLITARYAGLEVGDGSGVEVVSTGLLSVGVISAWVGAGGTTPEVGLAGLVGFVSMGEAVGLERVSLELQPARVAPAAMVAVSLRNVRRDRGGRRFIDTLLSDTVEEITCNRCALWVL